MVRIGIPLGLISRAQLVRYQPPQLEGTQMSNTDIEQAWAIRRSKIIHTNAVFKAVQQDEDNDHLFDVYYTEWSTKVGDEFIDQYFEIPALETMSKEIGDREVVSEKRVEVIKGSERAVYIEKRVKKP